MPRLVHSAPKYRLHRASGQAMVTILGRDHYLGPWRSKASRLEYDRLVSEWLANGRSVVASVNASPTITDVVAAYWQFAKAYYQKNGKLTGAVPGIKVCLRLLRQKYGDTAAADFGPSALRALQQHMVELGQSRRYVNDNVDRIRRVFKWAAAQEFVPVSVHQTLLTVPGLRKGRTDARELPPIEPVADATVDATMPFLPPIVADMVRFQRLTGCRPNELCLLRPRDVDRSEEVWSYRPASHKTEHHGRERVIFIGPKAQEVLRRYLLRDAQSYCFVPVEGEQERHAQRRAARQTPMTPSQAGRKPKANPKRQPGDHYTVASYRRAINRACDLAFPFPEGLSDVEQKQWRKSQHWSPNRLRHSAATEIRKRFGLEAAQVTLGHASADVSQIYAERDFSKAAAVMREIG